MNALHVCLDDAELGPAAWIGSLHRRASRSGDTLSFAYEPDWMAGRMAPFPFALDPDLPLAAGDHYAPRDSGGLTGIFQDGSPDRWGRMLMDRREVIEAREAGRAVHTLRAWDYLIGVDDQTRMGALRLREPGRNRHVDDRALSVPPMTELRQLESMAGRIERDEPIESTQSVQWFRQLVAPGASLGGARPKATFRDPAGGLWLAKFPSADDRFDTGLWEFLVHQLAFNAGIDVPSAQVLKLSARGTTFAVRRFDRVAQDRRMYASAMTLLGAKQSEGHGYLDLVAVIETQGTSGTIADDLAQLYRRVLFNVLVGNRDDHLRNHGFLRQGNGWRLAPAFDVNPNPDRQAHVLALDDADTAADSRRLESTADYYRLTRKRADAVASEVRNAVRAWRSTAANLGVPASQIATLAGIIDADR